jgi:formamidopyrimidine-DNA glycosylase
MPELPEVEILRRHLAVRIPGRRVEQVAIHQTRPLRPGTVEDMKAALTDAELTGIGRRAKYLVIEFIGPTARDGRLFVHLGMTGRLYLLPATEPIPRHVVASLEFGGDRLIFEDPRRFGRFTLDDGVLAGLGPEPLEVSFTAEVLAAGLKDSRSPVKTRLLDQSVVAGLGNIYVCESLHRAGISPFARAGGLPVDAVGRLHRAIREVLGEAIEVGQRIGLDFGAGSDGLFYFGSDAGSQAVESGVERFRVYDREGVECPACGGVIRRENQAGRSTYFCGGCQRVG